MPTSPEPRDTSTLGERQLRAAELRAEAEAEGAPPSPDSPTPQAEGSPPDEGVPAEAVPQAGEEPSGGNGPAGTGEFVVKQGECIASIAKDTGHFWKTIWDDPANGELRTVRKDPNVLLPGDRVHVPPLRKKNEAGQSEMRHRFRVKNQPEMLRIRVLRDGKPRQNQPYTLDVDGTVRSGSTDADGKVECPIAPNARRATLQVGAGLDVEEHVFQLGAIDPIDAISGVQGRLNNLGFDCGAVDGKWGPHTERALRKFQVFNGLPETGVADDATRERLQSEHGC